MVGQGFQGVRISSPLPAGEVKRSAGVFSPLPQGEVGLANAVSEPGEGSRGEPCEVSVVSLTRSSPFGSDRPLPAGEVKRSAGVFSPLPQGEVGLANAVSEPGEGSRGEPREVSVVSLTRSSPFGSDRPLPAGEVERSAGVFSPLPQGEVGLASLGFIPRGSEPGEGSRGEPCEVSVASLTRSSPFGSDRPLPAGELAP